MMNNEVLGKFFYEKINHINRFSFMGIFSKIMNKYIPDHIL